MGVYGQKIERHVARHQLYVHGGHTEMKWRVKRMVDSSTEDDQG